MALSIGPYKLSGPLLLAPMAGATDFPFRQVCRENGAALCTSEMLISDQSHWHTRKSRARLPLAGEAAPRSIQIAGADPVQIAEAARACVDLGAQIIDINMGCPAKKVCKVAAGSALLSDEGLVERILKAVTAAVEVPVTLKLRTGSDPDHRNGRSIARIAEQAGIAMLSVHGRTRQCRFRGTAEYDTITEIVQSVAIPVIANGDIDSPEKAQRVLSQTGAAGLMIGRAALGQPWLFADIDRALSPNFKSDEQPRTTLEKYQIMRQHLLLMTEHYNEFQAVRFSRKHVGWYLEKSPLKPEIMPQFNRLETSHEQFELLDRYADTLFESSRVDELQAA